MPISNIRSGLELSSKSFNESLVLTIDLFDGLYPQTVKAFGAMCQLAALPEEVKKQHEAAIGCALPPPLQGSKVSRVVANESIEFGTSTTASFFGPCFPDEPVVEGQTAVPHGYGTVSMSNLGPNTNASKYFICLMPSGPATQQLDQHHTVFGRITNQEALEALQYLAGVKVNKMLMPCDSITISRCGIEAQPKKLTKAEKLRLKEERFAARATRSRRTRREEAEEQAQAGMEDDDEPGAGDDAEDEDVGARPAKRQRRERTLGPLAPTDEVNTAAFALTKGTNANLAKAAPGGTTSDGFNIFSAQQSAFGADLEDIRDVQGRRIKKHQAKKASFGKKKKPARY